MMPINSFPHANFHRINHPNSNSLYRDIEPYQIIGYHSQFTEIVRAIDVLRIGLESSAYASPSSALQHFNQQIAGCKQVANYRGDISTLEQLDGLEAQLIEVEHRLKKIKEYSSEFPLINKAIKSMSNDCKMYSTLQVVERFNEQIADCKRIAYYDESISDVEQLIELEERLNASDQSLGKLWWALDISHRPRCRSICVVRTWFNNPQSQLLLAGITTLQLTNEKISLLPRELLKLSNLQELDLSVNEITDLFKCIGKFKTLKRLDLSYNRLEKLPIELCQCVALEALNISNNKIKEIPGAIFCLPKLTELNVSMNELYFPAERIDRAITTKMLNLTC
jgi:hypothetical protein